MVAIERHRRTVRLDMERLKGKTALENRDWRSSIAHYQEADKLSPSTKLRLLLTLLRTCPWLVHAVLRRR